MTTLLTQGHQQSRSSTPTDWCGMLDNVAKVVCPKFVCCLLLEIVSICTEVVKW